jgi:hypothetical protein
LASEKNVHEVEMTTVAMSLHGSSARGAARNDVGPDERAEIERLLEKVDTALSYLESRPTASSEVR